VLRALAPISNETILGYANRLPTDRHNPYFAPRRLEQLLGSGLESSDCRNTSNPPSVPPLGTGAPPCREMPPWTFNGETRSFPHLEPSP
jgi:hypothetical protein